MADVVEQVALVVREVCVYRPPPRTSTTRGYRAADWGLDKPLWTGRLKVSSKGSVLSIILQDSSSGELFAHCPIQTVTEVTKCVEAVSDSSRYFVIRVQDGSGRHAFLGMGFQERGDAFDFNVAIQDHFKRDKASSEVKKDEPYVPKHDFSLKEGQTFKLNIKKKKKDDDDDDFEEKKKPTPTVSLGNAFAALQPPSGGLYAGKAAAPAPAASSNPFAAPPAAAAAAASNPFAAPCNPFGGGAAAPASGGGGDDWGDFAAAPGSDGKKGGDWVAF